LKKNAYGFTLIELIVVTALMGIVLALGYPSFSQWQRDAQYKATARQLVGAIMEARSRAIANNLEYEIAFDLDENKYMLREGNRASYSDDWTIIYNERKFVDAIDLKAKGDCSENSASNFRFQFSPTGTVKINDSDTDVSNNGCICVSDNTSGTKKFRIGISSAATGKVELRKWNGSSSHWEI
jgi:prepilin-type N-terminal cleavage/methylation domain-containing protein